MTGFLIGAAVRPRRIFLLVEAFMKNLKRKPESYAQHNYQAKPLPFRTPLNGISDRALKNHHDKLYLGYVQKKNEIENKLEELGRMIVLHDGNAGNSTYS